MPAHTFFQSEKSKILSINLLSADLSKIAGGIGTSGVEGSRKNTTLKNG
jgi:hypothetical protein